MGKIGKNQKFILINLGNRLITAKLKQGKFKIPLNIENGKSYFIRFRYSISEEDFSKLLTMN
jgi:hypothetical protein